MIKTIEISRSLYERLGALAQPFETPEEVIERIISSCERVETVEPLSSGIETKKEVPEYVNTYSKLNITFFPSQPRQFKKLLLSEKKAWVLLRMKDGSKHLHEWNALRFTEHSSVLGNLRSGYLRNWRKKGIVNAEVAIYKNDLD